MLVIGIAGRAGSGKSTVADHLIERHGFKRGKFAGGLKAMFRALLEYRGASTGEIDRMIDGDLKERPSVWLAGRTPRHAMVTLGTEWGRDLIGADFWVDAALDHMNLDRGCPARLRPEAVVFDDVRFPNEVAAIRALGGSIWRVARTIEDLNPREGEHESERLAVAADATLLNAATKAELRAVAEIHLSAAQRIAARKARLAEVM